MNLVLITAWISKKRLFFVLEAKFSFTILPHCVFAVCRSGIIVCVRWVNTVCLVEREKDLDGRHVVTILYSPYFSGGGHRISNFVFIRKRSISLSDIIARIEIFVTVV